MGAMLRHWVADVDWASLVGARLTALCGSAHAADLSGALPTKAPPQAQPAAATTGPDIMSARISTMRWDRRTGRRCKAAFPARAARWIFPTPTIGRPATAATCSASRPATIICSPHAGLSASRPTFRFQALSAATTASPRRRPAPRIIWNASNSPAPCSAGSATRRILANAGHWLFYVTGGFAWSYDQFTRTQLAGIPAGGTAAAGTIENLFLVPRVGGAIGAGVELALASHWTAQLRISVHRLCEPRRHLSGGRAAF